MNFQEKLDKYADLAVEIGLSIKEKEGLVINCSEHSLELARLISKKAYQKGAKHVQLKFSDDTMTLDRYQYGRDYCFEEYPEWMVEMTEAMYKDDYAMMALNSPNPELLKPIDPALVAKDSMTQSKATHRIMHYTMTDLNKWCIMAVPNPAWAKLVFPELDEKEGMEALWEAVFNATRINTPDPIKAWKEHQENLGKYRNYLNEKQFVRFEYKAEGTDLVVEMPKNQAWGGGSAVHVGKGTAFLPNLPTEEVYAAPHRLKVNGTLKSTKPLAFRGNVIDGFGFTFKDGKVVDFYAEEGYEVLKGLLDTDEGARRLGEIALVPHDSPISNTKLLFKNTLFDENASCHFALGRAYPISVVNGGEMTEEELSEAGLNNSMIHVDFMVGSAELDIVAYTEDGEKVQIFKNGNFTF